MRVEKCPRCGDPRGWLKLQEAGSVVYFIACDCVWFSARSGYEAIKKFNRWARREAKRIAKEGKGK